MNKSGARGDALEAWPRRMMLSKSTARIVVGLVLMGSVAAAMGEDDLRGEGRARTLLVLRIAEALELSDDKAREIDGVLKRSQARREAIRAKRAALAPEIEKAIAAGESDRIEMLVAEAGAFDREALLVVADSFDSIRSVLPVADRGRLTLLIPELQRELRLGGLRRRIESPRVDSE